MCGRYLLYSDPSEVADAFDFKEVPEFDARYNIAPSQNVLVALQDGERRIPRFMRWGLVPSWATDPAVGFRMLNARCETAAEKPAFRAAFRHRRCLIPASGFYEWRKVGRKKEPCLFRLGTGLFAFAGLWEAWKSGDGLPLESCTILTTTANDLVRSLHDRMPVIIAREDYAAWLDVSEGAEDVARLFRPYPVEAMTALDVNPWVNDVHHEGPQCVEPAVSERSLFD
jgi:putative SOS response-associated peptidase YedK